MHVCPDVRQQMQPDMDVLPPDCLKQNGLDHGTDQDQDQDHH